MDIDSVCRKEHLTFLKYINPQYLFYSITSIVFLAVFGLAWILKKYTFFDKSKCKVQVGDLPTFPYGNLKDVVKQTTSLHEFLWKYYKRFKRKGYKFVGLFQFTQPAVLIMDGESIRNINKYREDFQNIFPVGLKLNQEKLNKIIDQKFTSTVSENSCYSFDESLRNKMLSNSEFSIILKEFFLESVCLAFGFTSSVMVDEINTLLKENTTASFKNYFLQSYPFFRLSQSSLKSDLAEVFLDIMENRKKNDIRKDDLLQCFIELYNETDCSLDDLVHDVFNVFSYVLMYSYSTTVLCIYELAKNKDIQEDLIGEIRRFNKISSKLNYSSLTELKHLDAIVKETLRKYPPVPTVTKKYNGCEQFDEVLPKDILIYISNLGIHRDPENFTNPDQFDPDRFTEDSMGKNLFFMPFGMESRNEIDMKLTILQMKIALINIFSFLRLTLKDGPSNLKIDPKLMCLGISENFNFSFESL